jgi:hypothetical protein
MPSDRTRAALYTLAAAVALLAALPGEASAQRRRPTPRTTPIEIRGQVPTPQVVTVRPRETPEFSRQVLVPNFYDRRFWPAILPGYSLVSRRALAGQLSGDSTAAPAPAGGGTTPPAAVPAGTPVIVPADTTGRPPGTAPAR